MSILVVRRTEGHVTRRPIDVTGVICETEKSLTVEKKFTSKRERGVPPVPSPSLSKSWKVLLGGTDL